MKNSSVIASPWKPSFPRATWLLGLTLLAACPSEPQPAVQPEQLTGLQPHTTSGSAIDQVQVVSPDEALDQATDAIDASNVLDELNALEGEMGDN